MALARPRPRPSVFPLPLPLPLPFLLVRLCRVVGRFDEGCSARVGAFARQAQTVCLDAERVMTGLPRERAHGRREEEERRERNEGDARAFRVPITRSEEWSAHVGSDVGDAV